MADFDPPFAEEADLVRLPTSTEQNLGIPCGPLDLGLMNGLFRLHNGNIGEVIREAGITGPDGDLTKLYRAIEALIAAAIGEIDPGTSGDLSQFVLMTQARARLPIYPEVIDANGRLTVTSPSTGVVRLAGGGEFLHRGIFRVVTTQTDFNTDASKTYHLRWNPTDGFTLQDLASGTYNPGTLAENNAAFDSQFDDMLIARVITNSSNVASITTLANVDRAFSRFGRSVTMLLGTSPTTWTDSYTTNFARTPQVNMEWYSEQVSGSDVDGGESQVVILNPTRYGFNVSTFTRNPSTGIYWAMLYGVSASMSGRQI